MAISSMGDGFQSIVDWIVIAVNNFIKLIVKIVSIGFFNKQKGPCSSTGLGVGWEGRRYTATKLRAR
jgi:hypothetical protein